MRAPAGNSANVGTFKVVGGGAIRGYLWRALPYVGALAALYELWNSYGVNPDGTRDMGVAPTPVTGNCWSAQFNPGVCYATSVAAGYAQANYQYGSGYEIIEVTIESSPNANFDWLTVRYKQTPCSGCSETTTKDFTYSQRTTGTTQQTCVDGVPRSGDQRCAGGLVQPITEAEAAALLNNKTMADLLPYVDAALDVLPLPLPQPVEVLEPIPSVAGQSTTTTGPGGVTTTETTWTGDASSSEPDVINWTEETVQTNPDGTTETTTSDEPIEQKDFCLENPNRVGCMQAGEPDDVDLPQVEKPVSITPQSFGSDNASCPADEIKSFMGQQITISNKLLCDFASGIRPVVIAVAWMIAGLIVAGMRTGADA